jgi:hypothetical protein
MKRNLKIVWCWWTRGGGVGFWVASIFGWRRRDFARASGVEDEMTGFAPCYVV